MSEPQYGNSGDRPFDKPTDPSGPPPQDPPPQPGYGQAPPPTYGQPQDAPGAYPQGGPAGPGYPPQQGAPGYPGQPGYQQQELSPADQRLWATLAHAGGIILYFLAPLVVYLVQKDKGLYVAEQSREALNWHITLAIGWVVAIVLSFVLIGFILFPILGIAQLVFGIIAAIASNKGENYRYPVALRLVK